MTTRLPHNLAIRTLTAAVALGALVQFLVLLSRAGAFRSALPAATTTAFGAYALAGTTASLACALSLAIVWRAAHRSDARLLALFLACFAFFWASIFQLFKVSHSIAPDGQNTVGLSVSTSVALAGTLLASWTLSMAAYLSFAAIFPGQAARPRWLTDRRIWGPALAIAALALLPAVFEAIIGPQAVAVLATRSRPLVALLLALYVALPGCAILFGVRLLVGNYRRAPAEDRKRALWVVAGFTAALGILVIALAMAVFDLMPDSPQAVALTLFVLPAFAPLVIVVFLAIAVFYTGAFDPRLVIRKTTVYAAVGLVLTGLFALVENLVSSTIARWLNLPDTVATMAASMAAALAIVPLQKYLVPRFTRRPGAAGTHDSIPAGTDGELNEAG